VAGCGGTAGEEQPKGQAHGNSGGTMLTEHYEIFQKEKGPPCKNCGGEVQRFSNRGRPYVYCTPECDKKAQSKRLAAKPISKKRKATIPIWVWVCMKCGDSRNSGNPEVKDVNPKLLLNCAQCKKNTFHRQELFTDDAPKIEHAIARSWIQH
jgi:hypothetical protein